MNDTSGKPGVTSDKFELTLKIIAALAWPTISVIVLIVFGSSLLTLIQNVASVSFKGVTLTLFAPGRGAEVKKNQKVVSFWTPSERTKEAFKGKTNDQIPEEDRWQLGNFDEQFLDGFGDELLERFKPAVSGYHRFEVRGKVNTLKSGYWWTLTVDEDFDTARLADFYFEQFQRKTNKVPEKVFIQEFGSLGNYVK